MKFVYILPLMVLSLVFLGCASSGAGDAADAADSEGAAATEASSGAMGGKTAYEGSTGSGLLMERYKAGQIEGYRD